MTAVLRLMSRRGEPSRRARRILVVVIVAGIPVFLVALQILDRLDWSPGPRLIAFALMLIAFSVPLLALQEFRRNLIDRGNPDERERQRRDEAYRLSYRIVLWGFVLAPLAGIFWDDIAAVVGPESWMLWFMAYSYVIFLPYMVFAWREPDIVD